eukprot:11204350-Lingulodinium_polyedra.AAC.1
MAAANTCSMCKEIVWIGQGNSNAAVRVPCTWSLHITMLQHAGEWPAKARSKNRRSNTVPCAPLRIAL